MGRQNTGAVPRRISAIYRHIKQTFRTHGGSGMIPPSPEESLPTFQGMGLRNDQHKFGEHTYDDDVWSTQYHDTLCGTWFAGPQFNSNECFRTPGKSLTNPFAKCTVRIRCGPSWISHSVENTSMGC
ncbi:hypothetical protein JTB14_024409 [Gonioctena quinquepunctata]|nr:hypothetical protein JTB14_024409 [Gonioctena quinquepunctata]